MTDSSARIEQLNANAPDFIRLLGGRVIALDRAGHRSGFYLYRATGLLPFGRRRTRRVCHRHARRRHVSRPFGTDDSVSGVASLDIATQFMGICRGEQPLQVTGWVKKATYRTAFLEAELRDTAGELIAAGQSVAKLTRQSTDASSR